ncbi:unnamed protein product [Timema podura]|uniref:THAP-type domain-containing protein n=1 Tax=Timema podura TaxID=61482 RepID=A0ABN7P3V2_TIMPD|nr:unnamed protein product [Timema podura]
MSKCCAYNCYVRSWHKLEIYRLPSKKDKERRKLWIQNIGRHNLKPTIHTRLCEQHFTDEQFKRAAGGKIVLKKMAVPTIFYHQEMTDLPPKRRRRTHNDPVQDISEITSGKFVANDIKASCSTQRQGPREMPNNVSSLVHQDDFSRLERAPLWAQNLIENTKQMQQMLEIIISYHGPQPPPWAQQLCINYQEHKHQVSSDQQSAEVSQKPIMSGTSTPNEENWKEIAFHSGPEPPNYPEDKVHCIGMEIRNRISKMRGLELDFKEGQYLCEALSIYPQLSKRFQNMVATKASLFLNALRSNISPSFSPIPFNSQTVVRCISSPVPFRVPSSFNVPHTFRSSQAPWPIPTNNIPTADSMSDIYTFKQDQHSQPTPSMPPSSRPLQHAFPAHKNGEEMPPCPVSNINYNSNSKCVDKKIHFQAEKENNNFADEGNTSFVFQNTTRQRQNAPFIRPNIPFNLVPQINTSHRDHHFNNMNGWHTSSSENISSQENTSLKHNFKNPSSQY